MLKMRRRFQKYLRPVLAEYGEFIAKRFLVKSGYKILNTNWKLKWGELDIVALDRNELVFIEVKTRKTICPGPFIPADAVDYKKMRKIKRLSGFYLERNEQLIKKLKIVSIRYDVIGVSLYNFRRYEIEHRPDAFD